MKSLKIFEKKLQNPGLMLFKVFQILSPGNLFPGLFFRGIFSRGTLDLELFLLLTRVEVNIPFLPRNPSLFRKGFYDIQIIPCLPPSNYPNHYFPESRIIIIWLLFKTRISIIAKPYMMARTLSSGNPVVFANFILEIL